MLMSSSPMLESFIVEDYVSPPIVMTRAYPSNQVEA